MLMPPDRLCDLNGRPILIHPNRLFFERRWRKLDQSLHGRKFRDNT
jgi:hypothetical protein